MSEALNIYEHQKYSTTKELEMLMNNKFYSSEDTNFKEFMKEIEYQERKK